MRLSPATTFPSAAAASLALLLSASPTAAGYDSPNFDRPPVESDALSLGASDAEELVAALAALASNFPDHPRVDDDLREKALALALALNPLHPEARAAHQRLLAGEAPRQTGAFASLDSLSAALWRHGERLAPRDAEPEDRRLAVLLMELSLLTAPGDVSQERLRLFQQTEEEVPLFWGDSVTLQPAVHPSNARSIALFRPLSPDEPEPSPAEAAPAETPPAAMVPPVAPAPDATEIPAAAILLQEAAVQFLGFDDRAGRAVLGLAKLRVRDPTEDEQALFGLFDEAGSGRRFEMRLTYDREGPVVAGVNRAESFLRERFPRWPERQLAEFTFQPTPGASAPSRVNLSLPALVLLGSAFTGEPVASSFAPGGDFALAGELGRREGFSLGDLDAAAAARAAKVASPAPRALFLPSDQGVAEASLLAAALAGEVELLFQVQILGYDAAEDLLPLVFGVPPGPLAGAVEDFAAVQQLTATMEPGAIARNPAVQEKLQGIVAAWPAHLSAKALLDYGSRPADLALPPEASAAAVKKAMEPVLELFREDPSGEGIPPEQAAPALDAAAKALAELRARVDPAARPLLAAAEKTLGAAKTFFSLNNRGSSMGQQRLRELMEQAAAFEEEGSRLASPR